ncbi:MAG: D-arabinono-1,4-lactone oxidase [Pseudonocardia sp.]
MATVPAGMTLRTLDELLWHHGRALANLGDIDAQTVAGAISTGTHGTGTHHPGLAAQVRGMEIVLADGSVARWGAGSDELRTGRIGLGALGVVTSLTLATVPAFHLHAVEETLPLDAALDVLDGPDDHAELYWFPHADVVTAKRNNRTTADGPHRSRAAEWLGDELLGNAGFAALCRIGESAPRVVPALNRFAAARFAAGEYVDRSYRVFTSPRRVRFVEMEYAVAREALPEAFAAVRQAAQRHAQEVTFPVEVRIAAGDDIPLSTAYRRDSAYLAVHVRRGRPHEAYFAAVEDAMLALDGRPHLGKLHGLDAAALRERHPGVARFTTLRDRLDPERRFANAYRERVLG